MAAAEERGDAEGAWEASYAALVDHVLGGAAPPRLPYGDAKVANREIRVRHGATEMGPWTMDVSKTPPTHLGSCRYLTLCLGFLDLSIIQ